jgi:outer membrane protein
MCRAALTHSHVLTRTILMSVAGFLIAIASPPCVSTGQAETMSSALARAYAGSPDLNQRRAGVRATDENLPRATSGWRPKVSATGQFGYNYFDLNNRIVQRRGTDPGSLGLTVTQNLFNGNRTLNGVRQAESNIFGARESLRDTEQNVLLNGATAYMNVLRDSAILDLRKNNIIVLEEQLRQTRDRFTGREVTKTDVAQAESSLATARFDYFTNQYRQLPPVIGVEPTRLEPARTIESLLPHTLGVAVQLALAEHPEVQAALHAVDAAVSGSVQQNYNYIGIPRERYLNGSIVAQVTVPLYEGGEVYAGVRQAKETLGQARLQADLQRDAIRAAVVSTWGQLGSARGVIQSSIASVKSNEIALDSIRQEAQVGQRTTFDSSC